MSEKTTLRAILGATVASAMVAASAAGAFATTGDDTGTNKPETSTSTQPVTITDTSDPAQENEKTDAADAQTDKSDETGSDAAEDNGPKDADPEDPEEKDPEVQNPGDEEPNSAEPDEGEPSDGEPADDEELGDDQGDDGEGDPEGDDVGEIIEAPEVQATVEGKMDVKAEWTVSKKVVKDAKKVTGKPGGSAKVPYRVEASATGVLSNIKVTGDMTVTNQDERDLLYTLEAALLKGYDPSELEELERILGSKCSFKGTDADPNMPGFQVWIASGKSLEVSYSCTAPDERVSGPELATAPYSFWAYLKAITAMGFAEEAYSDGYLYIDTSGVKIKNQLVDIHDVNSEDIGGESILLGTADAIEGKHVYDYTMNVSIPRQGCFDFDNTALAVNADAEVVAEDSATIKGCAEAPKPTKTEVKPVGVITAGSSGTSAGGLATTGVESTMLGAVGAGLIGVGALAFGLTRRARKG